MKTTIDTDLAIDASEEAKICLSCPKKRCTPGSCERLKIGVKHKKKRADALLRVEHGGYMAIQASNLHIMIYKDGKKVMHSSCDVKVTTEGLLRRIELVREIKAGGRGNEGQGTKGLATDVCRATE